MKLSQLKLETAFLDKNAKLFQEVFDELSFNKDDHSFSFVFNECEIEFKQGREPTMAEFTIELNSHNSLQDFAHRLQFIFYSQFGENYEPSVDLRKNRISFYDFDGRMWHLCIEQDL